MATFVGLMKFTDQGVKSIKELPKRVEENKKRMKEMLGVDVKSWHLTPRPLRRGGGVRRAQ
jgi:uncharacterized protein with GYD domain